MAVASVEAEIILCRSMELTRFRRAQGIQVVLRVAHAGTLIYRARPPCHESTPTTTTAATQNERELEERGTSPPRSGRIYAGCSSGRSGAQPRVTSAPPRLRPRKCLLYCVDRCQVACGRGGRVCVPVNGEACAYHARAGRCAGRRNVRIFCAAARMAAEGC